MSRLPPNPTPDRPGTCRAGDLTIDFDCFRVTRSGVDIPLPRLSFEMLAALVRTAPRVASLDELMALVWPGLVVSPETVSQRVKLLRDALGDDSRQPRYIGGVRGRGYRLLVDVEPPVSASATSAVPTDRPAASVQLAEAVLVPEPRRRWRGPLVAMAVAVLLLAGISIFVARHEQSATETTVSQSALPARTVAVLPFETRGRTEDDDLYALGIPETILHQLSRLPGLSVIAWTSALKFRGRESDVRDIGRILRARYLLTGSVQAVGDRLRVTAQLVDASSGEQLWSLRFDNPRTGGPGLFAMQDEIARKVAADLRMSVDNRAAEALKGSRSTDYEAYLAFLRGRALLAGIRVVDLAAAVDALNESVRRDPTFAPAHALLARAEMAVFEFSPSEDRVAEFLRVRARALAHAEQAILLDPTSAEAFVERAYLHAFDDIAAADRDFRRGLELEPSYARAYEGLASVLYQSVARRREALEMIDRARTLDPLEPRLDVTKATLLFYGPGDVPAAAALIQGVLARNPDYVPALQRLVELQWGPLGELAESVRSAERVLALDPQAEWLRRVLICVYVELGDVRAAESVATGSEPFVRARGLYPAMRRGDWLEAGEIAYEAIEHGTAMPMEEPYLALAIRMHARMSGDYTRAIDELAAWSGVSWDSSDQPVLEDSLNLRLGVVALADALMLSGDERRGKLLLDATLTDLAFQQQSLGRAETWLILAQSIALALLGDDQSALAAAERHFAGNYYRLNHAWLLLQADPAFANLHDHPRWRRLVDLNEAALHAQRQRLQALRAEGLVPSRS